MLALTGDREVVAHHNFGDLNTSESSAIAYQRQCGQSRFRVKKRCPAQWGDRQIVAQEA